MPQQQPATQNLFTQPGLKSDLALMAHVVKGGGWKNLSTSDLNYASDAYSRLLTEASRNALKWGAVFCLGLAAPKLAVLGILGITTFKLVRVFANAIKIPQLGERQTELNATKDKPYTKNKLGNPVSGAGYRLGYNLRELHAMDTKEKLNHGKTEAKLQMGKNLGSAAKWMFVGRTIELGIRHPTLTSMFAIPAIGLAANAVAAVVAVTGKSAVRAELKRRNNQSLRA